MNLDNDYDNDGNNIVPCPICLDVHCPSKEDGKCPEEDMFALEAEIRMLLGEHKDTGDNSRIVNVLEFVEKLLDKQRNSIHTQSALEAEGRMEDGETPFGSQELHETELAYNQALTDLADYHRSKVIE